MISLTQIEWPQGIGSFVSTGQQVFDFAQSIDVATTDRMEYEEIGSDSYLDVESQTGTEVDMTPMHQLCSLDAVNALHKYVLADMSCEDLRKRNKSVLEQLLASSGRRALRVLPDSWREDLAAIERDYPNFSRLFGHIRAMGSLSELDHGVIQLDPILLDGAAGSGKSTVLEILAPIIAGGFVRISMSAAETGAQIGGSASTWANSQAGLVFNKLVLGHFANPMILLDEIDKATVAAGERYSPLGPLYELLEPTMARNFKDLSLPALTIDASRVMWFATSNDGSLIPHPLRQRMQAFEIGYPSSEDALRVVESVFRRLKDTEPALNRFTLEPRVLANLATKPARTMRAQIRAACGSAIQCSRTTVTIDDLPTAVTQRARIGFCE